MKIPDKLILHHKKIAAAVVAVSVLASFLTPISETTDKISAVAPWVIVGVGVTEALFITGLLIMAARVGFELGPNPLNWKRHFKQVAHHLPEDKLVWLGFWINALGALGTGLVLAWGVVRALPPQSWGIIWVPFLDLLLTVFIRATILELRREYQEK